jgi:gamma-tubulin complex component 3
MFIGGLSGTESATKFEEFYSKLGGARMKEKWCVLYLLFTLSGGQDVSHASSALDIAKDQSFRIGQGLQSFPSSHVPRPNTAPSDRKPASATSSSSSSSSSPSTALIAAGADKTKTISARNHALVTQNSLSQVTELQLLRDIAFTLQGIDGEYIKYDAKIDGYAVLPDAKVPAPTRQLVRRICELGWMYQRVCDYVNSTLERQGVGLVEQSFCGGLQQELTAYYRLIAVLESQVNEAITQADQSDGNGKENLVANIGDAPPPASFGQFTLRRLAVWVAEPLERLRLMAMLVDAGKGLKGGSLASAIGAHLRHGDPAVRTFVKRLMEQLCKPIFNILRAWVSRGELEDPFGEFFVEAREVPLEVLWREKYVLRTAMLPSFISQELAKKILLIGKSINFSRHCCGDTHWATDYKINFSQVFEHGEDQDGYLQTVIAEAAEETNQRLMHLMLEKFKFPSHCLALKRYLLLGAGDFIQVLLDQVSTQLDKPAKEIYKHNLMGVLEAAIRASNVQYEDPAILDRLGVKLLAESAGDVGWDIFSLDYVVDTPLNVFFTPGETGTLNKYLRVFNFLWRIKRVELTLNRVWNMHMSMSRRVKDANGTIRKSHLLRVEMHHFITNLHNYMMFEVLECAWSELVEEISEAKDLEELITAHGTYLDKIVDMALMVSHNKDKNNLLDLLKGIFKVVINFGNQQDRIYEQTLLTLDKEHEKELQMDQEELGERGPWKPKT